MSTTFLVSEFRFRCAFPVLPDQLYVSLSLLPLHLLSLFNNINLSVCVVLPNFVWSFLFSLCMYILHTHACIGLQSPCFNEIVYRSFVDLRGEDRVALLR